MAYFSAYFFQVTGQQWFLALCWHWPPVESSTSWRTLVWKIFLIWFGQLKSSETRQCQLSGPKYIVRSVMARHRQVLLLVLPSLPEPRPSVVELLTGMYHFAKSIFTELKVMRATSITISCVHCWPLLAINDNHVFTECTANEIALRIIVSEAAYELSLGEKKYCLSDEFHSFFS